jgi:hypothetical protein
LSIIVCGRQVFAERLRRERCGLSLGACGQRRRARGKSKGKFQKVAAFHDISLVAAIWSDARRFCARSDECWLNRCNILAVVPANAGTDNHRRPGPNVVNR